MKLDSLKPLLHHDGPLTTVVLDATRAEEGDREVRSRWNGLRRELEQHGAPSETLDVIQDAVLRPTHAAGRHGRYLVASGQDILLDRVLADAPVRDEAFHDGTPSLMPAVRAADEAVRYLLVEIDRAGADITWSGTGTHAPTTELGNIEGGHDVLHKFGGGGWSHRRFQARVEDSWERNAEAVAAEVDRLVAEHRPDLVLVTGDGRAATLMRDAAAHPTKELLTDVQGGARGEGANEEAFARNIAEVLEVFRAQRREAVAEQAREALGRGEGAVTGLAAVVDVLRKGQVDEILGVQTAAGTSSARLYERTLWVGPEPLHLGLGREDVEALGVGADEVRELRADIAVLRAALAQDAGFTFVLEGSVDLAEGVGALLRWTDAGTPHESVPSYTEDTQRRG